MRIVEPEDFLKRPYLFSYQSAEVSGKWDIFHAHQGIEFLYIHEGEGQVIFDRQIYAAGSDTLIFFHPYQLHGTRMKAGGGNKYVRSMLLFDPAVVESALAGLPALRDFYTHLRTGRLSVQMIPRFDTDGGVARLLRRYAERLCGGAEDTETFALLVIAVLDRMRPFAEAQNTYIKNDFSGERRYAEQIMLWVEAHYAEEFQLSALADALHLSPWYVSRLFRAVTGVSITKYITARRIRQACWLLGTTSRGVQQIADMVGLSSAAYFCQIFKKATGMTPLQYKRGGAVSDDC
ncbi:MAG: AraC family transcriptional regulator [Clostridiales bacterium]|jgi:AraC-like DNA-binding protein|nr:AraC family transcriptional regulator [Clostridiales bacterium]